MKNPIYFRYLFFILFLNIVLVINAQDNFKSVNVLKNLLRLNDFQSKEHFSLIEFDKERKIQTADNINSTLKEIAKLRLQGKSPEEIHSKFNRNLLAVSGIISGKIFESDGITNIENFLDVYAFDEYGKYASYGFAYSNDGNYQIENLPAGKYYVRTNAYQYYINEFYNNSLTIEEAELVQVYNNQNTTEINFALDKGRSSISGTVRDLEGSPVPYCSIIAIYTLETYGSFQGYTSSDSLGNFKIEHLKPGDYKISCQYYGEMNYASQWYNNATNYNDAAIITVIDSVNRINFILNYGGVITGKVTKEDGASFLNPYDLSIWLFGGSFNTVNPDSAGVYIIKGLTSGEYKLRVDYNGMENYSGSWYGSSFFLDEAAVINVQSGDTVKNIDVILKPGAVISGNIFLENDPGFTYGYINVYDSKKRDVAGTYFYNSGTYTVNRIPPGEYKISAGAINYVEKWYNDKNNFENADLIVLNVGDSLGSIDFNLKKGALIKGTVYNPTGEILQDNYNVYLYDMDGNLINSGSLTGFGSYEIGGLTVGDYKLYCSYTGEENYADEWYNGKINFDKADTVDINSEGQIKTVNFNLQYAGSVAGFVTDNEGSYVNGEEIFEIFGMIDANTGGFSLQDEISFIGGYNFKLLPGDYKLVFFSPFVNFLETQPPAENYAIIFYETGKNILDTAAKIISLNQNQNIRLNNFKVEKVSGAITGIVYNINTGLPVNLYDYFVLVFDEEGYMGNFSYYLNDFNPVDGMYRVSGLRPGSYYVYVTIAHKNSFIEQWYNGINPDVSIDSLREMGIFKTSLPANLTKVIVGTSETSGIDFYFDLATGVNEKEFITEFKLEQNYPNPFNPTTNLSFVLGHQSFVLLKVFDVLGREVATIVNEALPAGTYKYQWDASERATGVYFYRLQTKNSIETKKLILLK